MCGYKYELIHYKNKNYGISVIYHGCMHVGSNLAIIYLLQSDITPEPQFIDRYIFSLLLIVSYGQYYMISNLV